MIWNYVEMVEVYKSIYSILEFGHACNYIMDNSGKTR